MSERLSNNSEKKPGVLRRLFSGIRSVFSGKSEKTETSKTDRLQIDKQKPLGQIAQVEWLESMYSYLYERETEPINAQIGNLAIEVLRSACSGANSDLVGEVEAAIRAHQLEYKKRVPDGLFSRIKEKIVGSVKRLHGKRSFEQLLQRLRKTLQTHTEYEKRLDAQAAQNEHEASFVIRNQAEKLPAEGQLAEVSEHAREIEVSEQTQIEQLIALVIEQGDRQTEALTQQLRALEQKVRNLLAHGTGAEIAAVLGLNRELLVALAAGREIPCLLNLSALQHERAWRRQQNQVSQELLPLFNEDAKQQLILRSLVQRNIIPSDIGEQLQVSRGYTTCFARMSFLENQMAQFPDLTLEERQAMIAAALQDLAGEQVSATIIEDLVMGRITADDLASYTTLDWLIQETQVQNQGQQEGKKRFGIFSKLKEIIGVGVGVSKLVAGMALAVPLALIKPIQAAIGIVGGLLHISGSGAGTGMEWQNPFTGVSGLDFAKERWTLHGFKPSDSSMYLRQKSSAKFNVSTGKWEDDTQTVTFQRNALMADKNGPAFPLSSNPGGFIKGKHHSPRKGFYSIPVPYGMTPTRQMFVQSDGSMWHEASIDRQSDGAYGYDLDVDQYIDHTGHMQKSGMRRNFRITKQHQIEYSEIFGTSLLEQYPFPEEQNAMEQLVHHESELPHDVAELLNGLKQQRLSQAQTAQLICEFVESEWYYSLDPANKAVFANARKKGRRAFVEQMLSYRKVKCDGAATVAIALLRYMGIPSRIVSGEIVNSQDTKTAKYAHAWVECVADGKLEFFDPTPSKMDSYTIRSMARSTVLDTFINLFKFERKGQKEYSLMEQTNRRILHRLLHPFSSQIATERFLQYDPYNIDFVDRKKRFKKMKADTTSLMLIEGELSGKNYTLEQLISLLDKREVASKLQIKIEALRDNLKGMLQPSCKKFFLLPKFERVKFPLPAWFVDAWTEYIPRQQWDTFSAQLSESTSNLVLYADGTQSVWLRGEKQIRETSGNYTTEFKKFLGEIMLDTYSNMIDRMVSKDAQRKMKMTKDIEAVLQGVTNVAPFAVLQECGIAQIIESYVLTSRKIFKAYHPTYNQPSR